ncbi:MAG: hypothetical protein ACJ764_11365 [Solirubrobacteraceae bacterium]
MRGFWAGRWIRLALVVLAGAGLTASLAAASSHRRPGCRSRCRSLGGVGGTDGACFQTAQYGGSANVSDSRTLTIKIGSGFFPATGDLLLAAVASEQAVTPPEGWRTFSTVGADGGLVEVFYKVAGERIPGTYKFTSARAQSMTGAFLFADGVDAKDPIEGDAYGAGASSGRSVTAPSITPSNPDSLLVFVGAARSQVKWTAPEGMKGINLNVFDQPQASRLGLAIQRWHPASATGDRTATISASENHNGQLLALHYPEPITCPRVKVLTRRFRPNRHGILDVRMKCQWTAKCQGAFEGVDMEDNFFTPPKIAASDFTIPAGATRTVPIAVTRRGMKSLKRHHRLRLDIFVWAWTSANQPVIAGAGRSKITAPRR